MNELNPSSAQFFEAKYRRNPDPWNFASNPPELFRYDAIIAALAHRHYRHAFEPGCSIGVLTQRLAPLCDRVDAIDLSLTAVAKAKERCAHLPGIHIACGSFVDFSANLTDPAQLDLLVLSEIGYYMSAASWAATSSALIQPMRQGTTILAAHWLGHSPDHRISGDEVHQILALNQFMKLQHTERHETFRLDRWERT